MVKEEGNCPLSRKILNSNDMGNWKSSPAYEEYLSFVKQLNDAAKSSFTLLDPQVNAVTHPTLLAVESLLSNTLTALVNENEPFESDTTQRFGNKAFRTWFDSMSEAVEDFFREDQKEYFVEEDMAELIPYLNDSFGNRQRIDYGTGHEMNFVIFLMGLYKIKLIPSLTARRPSDAGRDGPLHLTPPPPLDSNQLKEEAKNLSKQLLILFSNSYLPLVRKIQLRYTLEPAGSHGVYSLDDFQFLPFVWGSSQLVMHPNIESVNFTEKEQAELYAPRFLFHAAILFIHEAKKGPFAEHSNQLWNISGVEEWSKINRGLLKMYQDEVMDKFPVVQHLIFGNKIFRWER